VKREEENGYTNKKGRGAKEEERIEVVLQRPPSIVFVYRRRPKLSAVLCVLCRLPARIPSLKKRKEIRIIHKLEE
jgi:hypothetical protein